ncbi:MAG TPA: hypothetical protein VJR04_09585 [Terriglobales bacterium]|nr:hypothetical protein [Terriglobales bacterium]
MRSCVARNRFWVGCAVLIAALAGLSSYAGAQGIGDNQQSPPAYVLTGTVVNSSTGAPIPYALVQAEQSAKLADQNGNFEFDHLSSPSVTVQAHKPGFFGPNEVGEAPAPLTATLSNRPTSITIQLIPEAVISGHVENPEGEPVGGVPVRLRFSQVMNGRRIWQQFGHRQTDEDGNFRIADLRPGTYYVEAGPNNRARPIGEEQSDTGRFEVIPAQYYPGVREMSAATPLRLAPGQHATVDFGVRRVSAFRISGMIAGDADNGGLYLSDLDGDHVDVGVRFDHRTGRFQAFPVPAGSYRLRFNGRSADGEQLFADVPIQVTGNIPELHVGVSRTLSIPVEYQTDFTKPESTQRIPGGLGFAGSGSGRPSFAAPFLGRVWLISRKPPYQQFSANRESQDAPAMIRGLEPGTYDVVAEANGSSYVASMTCGGLNLLSQPLVIAEGSEPQPIEVLLRDDAASLNGNVQDSTAGQMGAILLIPDGETETAPRQVFFDPSGKFQAQGLAPGSYEVLAFDRLDGIEFRNRESLSAYLSHAAHITLSPEEQARVTVDLIHLTP